MDEGIRKIMVGAADDLRTKIVEKINSNIPPPNAPSTAKAKGSKKTLYDTGTMIGSVEVHVLAEEDDSIDIGVGIFEEGVATYAAANEFGSVRTVTTRNKDNEGRLHQGYSIIVIPERSFMRSTYDEEIEGIYDSVSEKIGRLVSAAFKR